MPEGDTIHYAANRIRPVLEGHVPDAIATPHPRFGNDRWPERLEGREVESVTAHGKHLFLRFAGDLTIHSHLRMTGAWRVHLQGARWHRAPRRAWLVITRDDQDVVQFDGPVLELLTETRRRFDLRLRALGPDIIANDFDQDTVLRRLREDDPTRGIGDALLDQRTIAGIGNLWKAEGCWLAEVDPWRADSDGQRRRGAPDLARAAPTHAGVRARRQPDTPPQDLQEHRPRLPSVRRAHHGPWTG